MAPARTCLLLACLAAAAFTGTAVESEKPRPVSKVMTLLKDMVKQLEIEAEEDKAVFEEFGCWCETGLKTKTQAITDAEQNIGALTSSIEELSAGSARLNEEIGTLNKEVAANTEALEKATAMREKELAEFTAEEKEGLASIASMGGAIDALSKHAGASLLQVSTSASEERTMEAEAAVAALFRRHRQAVPEAQRKVVDAFLAAPGSFFGYTSRTPGRMAFLQQSATLAKRNTEYAPASAGITGVLKGMKESFETNLASSQEEEQRGQADYAALKKAKSEEIAAGTNLIDVKTGERADADEKHAQSEKDLKDTERTLAADKSYLANLKDKCANIDGEYEERTKTRQLEITAVSKALAYLSSDEAKDLFSRTLSFLQVRRVVARIPIGAEVAGGEGATSAEAAESQGGAIKAVEKSVGDMVDELVVQKEEGDKLKDFCVDTMQKTESDLDAKHRTRQNYEAKIADHENLISKLTKEVEHLTAEIHSSRVSLKRATEDREKTNKDFQTTVADQRATKNLLAGALKILKAFYDKAALVQATGGAAAESEQPAGPPPPSGFKKAAPSAQSGGVMGMIEQIVKDAEAMVEEALNGEKEAQEAYESLVGETNASIVAMQKAIVQKNEAKAQESEDKAQKEVELKNVLAEIAELEKSLKDLHEQCDFHLANYDDINQARDQEIHGLKEAIAIVAGQKFAAAAQR